MNFLEHNDDGDSNKGSDSDIGGDNGEKVHENSQGPHSDGENGVDEDPGREENDCDNSLLLASNFRRCQDEIDPAILIGRTVVAFFNEDPYVGTVTSFRRPEEDDSPDIAESGTWFTVTYEDKDFEEYTYEQLLPLLIVDDQKKYGLLSNKDWVTAKKMFKTLSENLQS